MTSVGYGDVGPKNILERIVCTIMVMSLLCNWHCWKRGKVLMVEDHYQWSLLKHLDCSELLKGSLARRCCTLQRLSGLCWAYVIGQVCAIVADISAESQSFRQRVLFCIARQQLSFANALGRFLSMFEALLGCLRQSLVQSYVRESLRLALGMTENTSLR